MVFVVSIIVSVVAIVVPIVVSIVVAIVAAVVSIVACVVVSAMPWLPVVLPPVLSYEKVLSDEAVVGTGLNILSRFGTTAIAAMTITAHIMSEAGE